PVYNGKRYIADTLESVFAQTFCDYEIVCVDDGSTDGSAALLEAYGERVRVVRQSNAGQSAARNAGAALAQGQYIAFLDQDDRWYPSKLEQQVAALTAAPDAVLAHCNYDRVDADGRMLQTGAALSERATALASPLGRLLEEALIFPSAMLVRRDAFQRAGGFDPALRGFEDFDLIARLKRQGRFVLLNETGMAYRFHGAGFSRAGGTEVMRSRERFLVRMQELYAGDRTKETLIQDMLADCYSDWGIHEARQGNRAGGRAMLARSLLCHPGKMRTYSRLIRASLPQLQLSPIGKCIQKILRRL
ncbi:MAG TPA: glycosyltransferase family A protein, partial [Nitrospira sp.]|nr:glycosyltransferase family A protein [Nitrospira sp.]